MSENSRPSITPPHAQRSFKRYLLNPKFQLKYTAYLVIVVLTVMAALGVVIFNIANASADHAQFAAVQAEKALKESQTTSKVLRTTAANEPALLALLGEDLDAQDKEYEKNLAEVQRRKTQVAESRQNLFYLLVGGGTVLLVLLVVMGIFITHRIVGPVFKMKRLLRQVATGKVVVKERLRKGDELSDLFETFLQMSLSLKVLQLDRIATLDAAIESGRKVARRPARGDGEAQGGPRADAALVMSARPRLGVVLALAALLPAGCGVSVEPTPTTAPPVQQEQIAHCAYLADAREGARCLAPMPAPLAAHRGMVWLVHTVGTRVTRIEHQNAYGEPVPEGGGVARHEYQYEGDRLTAEMRYGASGRLVARWLYSPDGARVEVRDGSGALAVDAATGAAIFVRRFDARGFVASETYLDASERPANPDGATEYRYARDDAGFIETKAAFDANGRPSTADQICAEEKFERNNLGGRKVTRCYDGTGQPAVDAHGVHLTRRIFDDAGNLVEERFYGVLAPTTYDGKGIHRFTHRIDDKGLTVESLNIGLDDKPAANPNGIAALRAEHDAHGRLVRTSHFDAALRPLKSEAYGARLELTRDEQGRIVERRYLDVDGSTIGRNRLVLDERDLETEAKCLDDDGRPRACNGRATGWRNVFDARRRMIETTWVDTSGAAVENKDGVATIRFTYGPNGKKHETPLDASGARVVLELGAKHILLRFAKPGEQGRTRDQARRRAAEALEKIKKGMPFDDAVAAYSDDPLTKDRSGDLGTFRRGTMVKPLDEAIVKLQPGQVSEVVETVFGFHIVLRTK